jgi:DNA-binding FadR family transcriptional regulator
VRESIKLLEEKGLVRASSGLGTRVLDGQKWNLLDPVVLEATIRHDASLKILDELVSVRAALEADMAAEAARQIGSADRADLTARVALLKSLVNDHAGYLAAGLSFHEKVMALSGNRLGQSIVHSILDKAHLSLAYRGTPTQKDFEQTQAEHEEMQRHIASGDPDKAATATRSHIVDAWARRRPTAARPTRSS